MSKEVQAAVGTQRQFAKQPEMPYALSLNKFNASTGISQRTDLDAQRLASSLGLLGKNIMEERIADEKRTQDQAVLVNADKLLAGKTQEDLKKFDRMAALQNSSADFDLTDNRYAMAVLEKGIGKMASQYAKEQWMNDPASEKPKSVSEAVSLFNKYLQENRANFSDDGISNKVAFDQGYYEGAVQDTIKIANEADKRINDDKRQKMVMLGSSEFQDLVYSGAKGEDFLTRGNEALRKVQLGARDRDGFIKAVAPLAQMIADQDFDTARLDALGDYQYEDGLSLKQMVNLYPSYTKIADNFNLRVTENILKRHKRPDGTYDLEGCMQDVDNLPKDAVVAEGIPEANLPISQGDNPDLADLSPTMKSVLPVVGGAIYQLGFKNAQITSGYRTAAHNASVGGVPNSAHTLGNAVDIYLGDNVDEAQANKALSYFKQYFGEVLFHDAGSGRHLHLADYHGGMKAANPKEQSAAAYSPQRRQKVRQAILAAHAQAQRVKAQRDADERDRITMALLKTNDPSEQMQIINSSNLPETTKATMSRSILRETRRSANYYGFGAGDKEAKHFWDYENGYQYIADTETYAEWYKAYKDPNVDGKSKEYIALQKEANRATARLNKLLKFKKKRGLIPGEQAETTQSKSDYDPNNDTPILSDYDQQIAQLKILVNSNPTDDRGVPLDEDQIHRRVEVLAQQAGLDVNKVLRDVFGAEGNINDMLADARGE